MHFSAGVVAELQPGKASLAFFALFNTAEIGRPAADEASDVQRVLVLLPANTSGGTFCGESFKR